MISSRILICGALALAACGGVPNDVAPRQQALDQAGLQGRQQALNGEVSSTPFGLETAPGVTGDAGSYDPSSVEGIAAAAIANAEQAGAAGGVFDNIQPQQASDVLPPPIIPRVAAFAIRTTHQPGQRQWRRNPLRRPNMESCTNYQSRDLAQDAFLHAGGPERDLLGLDPDGDGFVCGFDPAGYRADAAAANAPTDPALTQNAADPSG